MKKMIITAAAAAFVLGGLVMAPVTADAGVLCAQCHKGHKKKIGPAFTRVVEAYGSVDAVFEFLNSDRPLVPKVTEMAKKKNIMKGMLKKYRKMNDKKKADVRAWFEASIK
ncbi:MAG: hypothetical protein Q9M82_06185 [Mariprofundus sp.]|nr:hypothetical protein [Mariprofundus sp.]